MAEPSFSFGLRLLIAIGWIAGLAAGVIVAFAIASTWRPEIGQGLWQAVEAFLS